MTTHLTESDFRRLTAGGPPTAESERAAEHLNECPACQAEAERLTAVPVAEHVALLAAGAVRPADTPMIDRYADWRELGRGGHGVVFRAVERASGRVVAVKLLRGGALAAPAEKAWFRAEAEAAAGLDHPNVVRVLAVGGPDTPPHFVMEFVPGGSLADALDGTPISTAVAARLVRTVADAVQHAHARGVIHRDLKPGNVLLGDGPDSFAAPKVSDFGMAKSVNANGSAPTPTQAVLGTPAYMAPEQAFGRSARVCPAADVYSLGAILYELLTGRPPFRGETPYETLLQVRSLDPVPPRQLRPDLSADLERVCLKCLEKDPKSRYPTAQAVADELNRFLRGEPVSVRPPGLILRVARWVRRKPRSAALLAAGGLVILAALAASVFAARAEHERARRLERERTVGGACKDSCVR